MNFKHARWTKNYPDEHGAFARLPWFARAAARQLQGACDDAGRIDVGEGPDSEIVARLVATVAFRMGATRGDRRLMAMLFPLLFDEGYLVARGRFAVIRNFVAAQRRWDDEATTTEQRPSNEATTTEQRSDHDRATTEQRSSNEAATKQDVTTRNHESDNASARARAHSSVPSSSETTPEDVSSLPASKPTPVEEVFGHWRRVMESPRSKLDAKRARLIREAIGRHGVEDCKRAVDGCFADDFNMNRPGGGNTRGRRFNSIDLIFRDADKTEGFIALAANPAAVDVQPVDTGEYRPPKPIEISTARSGTTDLNGGLFTNLFGGARG